MKGIAHDHLAVRSLTPIVSALVSSGVAKVTVVALRAPRALHAGVALALGRNVVRV